MQKFTKLALASVIAMTAIAGVGCSSSTSSDKPAASTTTASTDTKEDATKVNRAVFAAALIADEKMANQFTAVKGLEDGKDVSYNVPKDKTQAVDFLSAYWDKDAAGKEMDAQLGDASILDKANKAVEAKVNKDNESVKDEAKKAKFKPLTAVADPAKYHKNDLSSAAPKFEDAKIDGKDGTFTIEYKGLKYTLKKDGTSYKVTAKEGQLQK